MALLLGLVEPPHTRSVSPAGSASSDGAAAPVGRLETGASKTWQAVLDQVEVKLQAMGFQATTRVKTTGTLRDKLRRPGAPMLKDIHDLAGARIVVSGDRIEQDEAGARIREAFAECPKPPLVVDRRQNPSFGYRALHVVVFPEKIPVEIQIRTGLQDGWAQIVESLGDSWGRGIRYGSGPDDPDALNSNAPWLTRAQTMDILMELAERIDAYESVIQEQRPLGEWVMSDPEASPELMARWSALTAEYTAASQALGIALSRLTRNDNAPGGSE
jgi:ppGpp synthetase/RelA/SpoT-type nucleotidyltranferase